MAETKTVSKMHAGIITALEMINNGDYTVDREKGEMYNKVSKKIGSLDKPSGSVFYVIKGVDILAHRLLYAYYNGCTINALVDDMVVKHLDGNKANNAEGNLVQVPRKGQKQALEDLKAGRTVEVSVARAEELEGNTEVTEEEPTQEVAEVKPTEEDNVVTPQGTPEEQATALLQAGELSIKEVAEQTGLKYKKVWGMKKKMGL
jgi:hypothetical protein